MSNFSKEVIVSHIDGWGWLLKNHEGTPGMVAIYSFHEDRDDNRVFGTEPILIVWEDGIDRLCNALQEFRLACKNPN